MLSGRTEHGRSSVDFLDQIVEVGAGEFPLEGRGDGLIVVLETKQAILDISERGEVIGGEGLALHDGEVDLDLVEPTGVDRAVDEDEIWESRLKSLDRGLAAMGGAIVDDPEHAAGVAVGRLAMTWATRRSKGSMPVVCSQRPKTLAR